MKFRVLGFTILLFAAVLSPQTVHAQAKFKGLTVSPVSQEMKVSVGQPSAAGNLSVENNSDETMTVNFSVKQFTAEDYTYDIKLFDVKKDWIRFDTPQITLRPDEIKKIKYSVNVPDLAQPGGHYFALVASAAMGGGSIASTGQVISQLFLQVDGELIQTGKIENGRIPFLVFNGEAPYSYDVYNTGNMHFTAKFYAKLHGPFVDQSSTSGTMHVLLPGTVRRVGGYVEMPFLPGLYMLTYGYNSEALPDAPENITNVLYIPPWSIVALVLLLMIAKWFWQVRHARHKMA